MTSSWERDPLQEALEEFRQRLHFKVPVELAHCCQFSNEKEILKVADEEKTKVWLDLLQKLGDLAKTGQVSIDEQVSIVNQFAPSIQLLVDEVVTKHGGYKEEAEAVMKGRIRMFCEYFSSSIREKLLLNKDMDIHTLDEYLERGKSMTLNHFGNWRHGNLEFYDDHEKILKEELEKLANEVLKNQWKHLGGCVPVGEHGRNEAKEIRDKSCLSADVAPTSESNIPAVAVVTETLSNVGTLNKTQMGIAEENRCDLDGLSVKQYLDPESLCTKTPLTGPTVTAEIENFENASSSNQPPSVTIRGSKEIGDGDGTFTTSKSHWEEPIPLDSISPTGIISNIVDNATFEPHGFGGTQLENIDPDLNDGISPKAHGIFSSNSEVVVQSEGFSDEENITVVHAGTWTSTYYASLANDQTGKCFIGIEKENEMDADKHRNLKDAAEKIESNSNTDNITTSNSMRNDRKRRRSPEENNSVSIGAKRRRKIKQVPTTAPRQSPALKVKRKKNVANAVANSSAKVGRSNRNSNLMTGPKDTVNGKKRGRPAKFVGTKAKIVKVEGGYQCPEPACEKIFQRLGNYRRHHNEVHQLKDIKFKCPDPGCKKVFSSKRYFAGHQLFHIQPELFTCGNCHRTFTRTSTMREHSKSCHGNKAEPSKCP